jgi:hypothetical protein
MIEHVWTVLCARSVIDQETNNISLFEVLEQLNLQMSPPSADAFTVPMSFEVVTLWSRGSDGQPARGRARVVTIGVSGSRREAQPYDIDLTTFQRIRNRTRFMGFEVQRAGRMEFGIELQGEDAEPWRRVATVPLVIVFEAAPTVN